MDSEMIVCKKCGGSNFSSTVTRKRCKDCAKESARIYNQKNKEKLTELKRIKRAKNKEKYQQISRDYYLKNRDRYEQHWINKRIKKYNATPKWANYFVIYEIYALARLRTKLTGIKWEVDHIVPLISEKVCGLHCEQNLQVIPMIINRRKYNLYWPDMS